jgi:protein tyrosine phosphatase (PTP) superfamily phosphohydrolase (DUF442 family)
LRLTDGRIAALAAAGALALVHRRYPGGLPGLVRAMTLELADRATPDVTWVAEDLAIGGRILPDEWPALRKDGVEAVIDCRSEACDPADVLENLGIAFLNLPTIDSGNFTSPQVVEGVAWVEQQWAAGRRVLVHCQAGKGRSVLIGAAALSRRGVSPDDALALIRKHRPIITPTPGQIARLREYVEGYQLRLPM